MGIVMLNSGLLTTVQDRGRMGYQRFGFHVSGAMDKRAFEIANALVGNNEEEAVLEFAVMGPEIRFDSETVIALAGADFQPTVNGNPIEMYRAIHVKKGDILKLSFPKDGVWGYVAFAGGLDVPLVMGSRSTDMKSELGGFEGRKLRNGDEIKFLKKITSFNNLEDRKVEQPVYKREITKIRVVLGPQDDYFSEKGISTFLNTEYVLSGQCDRMGYRLTGPEPIEHNEKGADIISDGIAYGSIQVPSQGQPIVLLSDRQTTGGYTKIATVIGHDIPEFVQRKPGERIIFEAITTQEAQALSLEEYAELEELRARLCPKTGLIGLFQRLFGK